MSIKGILFDIGGVLYIGDSVIEGATETIKKLKEKYYIRFLTNTTRKAPETVLNRLNNFGFNVKENELFTALRATKDFLKEKNATTFVIATNEAKEYLRDFNSNNPNFVVVADAYKNFTYDSLNQGFRYLLNGAELVAAAKNRYFKDSDNELSLDAGAFVKALEFASQKEAKILGKPSIEFFNLAVKSMNLKNSKVLMVGDDIENDILGAKNAGLKTALVKTGKFQKSDLNKGIKPDYILENVNEIFLKITNLI